ncbi:MAG: hypothetical protein A3H64_00875 [Candidatus Ryanbacteria bacterium RIFCSPLOWO2_02_FULL_45_11c]|uniref:Uncharacterized protein n=1 Tax=Candidatus Ryanbacteria bacterium RIFCSPLOWO2_02_FULL_45_11c TaxID=1802128 RepID=A0A1G2H304_9BACT|nr:MAG: hypothetical protein A3H64_00875 [Candidatus Ryanbacteria bacterium RIFCSPLOWO2_02_FULL_45_11c]
MKKFQFVSWLSATGVGIVVLVLMGLMLLTREASVSLIHTTNNGEGCHILSSNQEKVTSLFVFRRDPQGPYGLRQMYQIDIFNPHEDTSNIFETGEVKKALSCLKWAGTDQETNYLPSNVRQILALRSQN